MSAAAPEPRPPRRRTAAAAVVLLAAAVLAGCVGSGEGRAPTRPAQPAQAVQPPSGYGARPPGGVPLLGPTGLRLLVPGEAAPVVLDVDRGTVRPVTGLPTGKGRLFWINQVGEDAVVVSERPRPVNDPLRVADVFLVRHGGAVATRLAVAADAAPSRDGRGVWLLSYQDTARRRCVLDQVALDGGRRRPARPMACQTSLGEELPAGLLVDDGAALVTPGGGLVRLHHPGAAPAGGNLVLRGAEAGAPLTLADVAAGASWRLGWPSRLKGPQAGLGPVRASPDGRLAVVGFGDPADPGPEQALDLWLLDLATRRWQQLPGMPARVALKGTDLRWTADGRLVILAELVAAEAAGGDASFVVARWRPGERRLAVRPVRLPTGTGGSFVFG
jgi:hypothetical protein